MAERNKLLKYSREFVLACREPASRMHFPSIVIPTRVPRGARKKSQSTDTEGNNVPGGSHEDLNAEEVDPSWHRPSKQPWNHNNNNTSNSNQPQHPQSGYFASHSRHRYPSGSHLDLPQSTANISLRAAPPSDNRRGGHGDWSRGCAGWRQRSYSGSERSELAMGYTQTNFRGRGTGGAHVGPDGTETNSRGRGRGRGRYAFQHRGGPGSRGYHTGPGGHRPVSFIGSVNSSDATEEFWQDEDWDSVGVDSTAHFEFPSKPRERLNSKTSVDGLSNTASVSESVGTAPSADMPTQPGRDLHKARVYSKSCSADPPPGFDVLSSRPTATSKPHPDETAASASPQTTTGDTQARSPSPTDMAALRWYYIDSVGRTQGPFIRQQMCAWLTGGYLPVTIEIRRECDECFLTIGEHIGLTGRIPFSEGYPLPPLTRSNLPALVAASKKPAPNPRWITTVAPPNPQSADLVTDLPAFSPSVNNVMAAATAAAAPALALFFATAASLASPTTQPSQQPPFQQLQPPSPLIPPTPSVVDAQKMPALPTEVGKLPTPMASSNPEILRLYTEAQALAAHAAKVEAERQELADKLAAINSTAAKLLAASPGLSPTEVVDPVPTIKPIPPSCTPEVEDAKPLLTPVAKVTEATLTSPPVVPVERKITQEHHVVQTLSEVQHSPDQGDEEVFKTEVNLTETAPTAPKHLESMSADQATDMGINMQPVTDVDATGKKTKKKNKKSKKKITPEQERQLAWEAEFERRKAAALERKLAEEAEQQRIAEEEAAAIAAEEEAQRKEQLRLIAEQRKREQTRVKAASQLGQLRLPKTACWGGSAPTTCGDSGEPQATGGGSSSLLAIQAAQAMEEAERKKHDALVAEQAALLAEVEVTHSKPPQAWAAVVNTNLKATPKHTPMPKPLPAKSELPTSKGANQNERTKPSHNGNTSATGKASAAPSSTGATKSAVAGTSVPNSTSSGPSIWDLPGNGKAESTAPTGKNSKKHNKKKNTRVNREAASYAAKEQLAHWCESQLSSIPLSGLDLPTLVDLLCELEAAEQVVEFIESSLGRSKQISQFSKAFLEKRACVLNVP